MFAADSSRGLLDYAFEDRGVVTLAAFVVAATSSFAAEAGCERCLTCLTFFKGFFFRKKEFRNTIRSSC